MTGAAIELLEALKPLTASPGYTRLLLLVGPPRTGKTAALRSLAAETRWPVLALNMALAERMLAVPVAFRASEVGDAVIDLAAAIPGDGLIVDNIELLFQPDLQVDPLALLRRLARNRVVVAAWPGRFDGDELNYATPEHVEYRRYSSPGCAIVRAGLLHTPAPQPALQSTTP